MNDPCERVVPSHCMARPGYADLVVAQVIGLGAPRASGEERSGEGEIILRCGDLTRSSRVISRRGWC